MSPAHKPKEKAFSRHARIGLFAAAVCLAGCSTFPSQPAPAPAVQPLEQYMVEAQQAVAAGSRDRARDLYRTAARNHPTSKEPWLRLAEDHFEVGDYGQAILASQEVLHRDPNDTLATSVLAVSGLRLSSSALSMLRRNTLSPDARFEAEGLARTLREVLGEPVLVPRPPVEVAPAPPPPPPPKRKTAPRRDRPTAAASAPAPAPKKPPAANPFDVLKK